jgi:uncharacterized membrane protein YcaP (DUF421 family)
MESWAIVLFRTVLLFFLTLVISRVMGKSSLSKATPFKFISYIAIGVIASLMSLGVIKNIVFGLITLAVWLLFSIALDYLSMKSKWIHNLVNGRETILIKDGKVMEENLADVRYTGEELLKELRTKNAFNLADVEFAVMEYTGDINVLLKSDKKPITPHDLEWKVAPGTESQTVILDGNILDESLSNMGLNREWLKIQLSNSGVSLDNVFIGQVDSSKDLFLDLFDDSIEVPKPKVKELLYANISKVYSDFLSFSLETDEIKAKKMYSKNADILKQLMDKMRPYLLR